MTLESVAAAKLRLVVWCKGCGHRSEPDPAEQAREGVRSVWLSDHTRPFVIVLVEAAGQHYHPLGPFGHSALPARAGRRSTGYMPRRAVKADRHALRSMPATLSAIPCGLPTPTAIRSSSLLARRSGLPCSRRRKDKPGWFWVSTMEV